LDAALAVEQENIFEDIPFPFKHDGKLFQEGMPDRLLGVKIYRLQVFGLNLEGAEIRLAVKFRAFVHPYFDRFLFAHMNFSHNVISFLPLELNLGNGIKRGRYLGASPLSLNKNFAFVAELPKRSFDALSVNHNHFKFLGRLGDLFNRTRPPQSPHSHEEQKANEYRCRGENIFHLNFPPFRLFSIEPLWVPDSF
jgi:hypothetical protein